MSAFRFRLRDKFQPVSVAEYRALAQRRLPQLAWAYLDGAADDLWARQQNQDRFRAWRLRQRVLSGVTQPKLATTIIDTEVAMPVALAPTGLAGLTHWSGELAIARAAESAGTRCVLSTASSYTLEEVAQASAQRHWFQLYPWGDRVMVADLIDRAKAAGYSALIVTVDVPVQGNRQSERHNGMGLPLKLDVRRCLDFARHPRWLAGVARHGRVVPVHFVPGNLARIQVQRSPSGVGRRIEAAAATQRRVMQNDLNWADLEWMREKWSGPLLVKGLLDADDAERAVVQLGASGVIVSNHGGRQLDRAVATIDALPAIADRVGDRAQVYLDGGIRRGTDVVTALCLGADGVFIGRPYLYGLAAEGQQGVQRILEIFAEEIKRALILMGCEDVRQLDRSWLVPGAADPNAV
jgi:isopentenyl diphosphate isomerase/L-lactate dehydrogenase-like FMN-dependent dehydrogenase